MSNPSHSGHAGRAHARRAARPTYVLAVVVCGLALRPAPGLAQVSFVTPGQVGSHVVAPGAASTDISNAGEPRGGRSASFLYGAHTAFAINRWLALELEARQRATVGESASAARSVEQSEAAHTSRTDAAFLAQRAIDTADRLSGTRYRWGGDAPGEGFDCSGFVRYVYAQQGIHLPRVARHQARAGRRVPTRLDGLRPGDLLFFAQRGTTVDHVAIYAGDGRIIHASRNGYGVRYDELSGPGGRFYARHLVAVRRVIEDGGLESGLADESDVREMPIGEAVEAAPAEPDGRLAPPPPR